MMTAECTLVYFRILTKTYLSNAQAIGQKKTPPKRRFLNQNL